MTLKIGLQLYTVRNSLIKDAKSTLEKIADIGYKHIEVPIFIYERLGKEFDATEFKQLADQVGLNIMGTHFLITEGSQLEKVISIQKELECNRVTIPIAFFKNYEEVVSFSERLNRFGEKLNKQGIKLYYHNHFHELQRLDGQTVLETILDHTDKDLVGFEFDTYWALRAGMDVNAFLEKLGERCELIHQKDLPNNVSPVNIFETIVKDQILSEDLVFSILRNLGNTFTEIGEGVMNIENILQTAIMKTNTEYIIVEQDLTSKPELESAEISYNALSSILNDVMKKSF